MNLATVEELGPPSVGLKAFQLWVHGRQFPEAEDRWDGNWLNVTAHCGQAGASVWATGAILDTIGLLRFRKEHELDLNTPLKEILHKDQWPHVWEAVRAEVGQPGPPRSPGRAF